MAQHFDTERALQAQIEQAAATQAGVEVLDVELDAPRRTVRVFIDHPDGVGHDLCASVTHALSDLNDEYALEVSSPGIERPLRHRRHFAKVVGERVRLQRAVGQRAHVYIVEAADPDALVVHAPGGEVERISYGEIIRCRLVVDTAKLMAAAKAQQKGRA